MRLPFSVRRRGRLLSALLAGCSLLCLLSIARDGSAGRAASSSPDCQCEIAGSLGVASAAGSGANASLAAGPSLTPGRQQLDCQAIHVALIVGGQTATRYAVTVVKSVLFHRSTPIHLHLVTAGRAERVLKTLFRTWRIPHLRVDYYDTATDQVSWLSNTHYSGVYGLLKLTLPSVLPRSLERVIVLDTDVAVTADPLQLWQLFGQLAERPGLAIGLADNLSDWYLSGKAGVWPALGRGFNTGVMLMHLARLRAWGWDRHWPAVARECAAKHGPAQLADQILATESRNPSAPTPPARRTSSTPWCGGTRVYWNVQLGDHTQPELCYRSPANLPSVRILHWNSPLKVWGARRHRFAQHFHTLYMTYLDYDGGLLRRRLFACPDDGAEDDQDQLLAEDASGANSLAGPAAAGVSAGDECYEMRAEQRLVRRTHLYYLEYNYTAQGPHDVTLVSQLSLDRVQLLESLSRHWAGPISLCIYVTDAEAHQLATFVESSQSEGHRATDFTRWKSATQSYPVTWQADFEPYVVIGRDAARFDTRFVGFGWNKVSFIMQLDILGFAFRVLPNAFIVHLPHAPSLDVARFRFIPEYRHCINTLKVEYIKYLAKRHGVRALKYLSFRRDA
uniref:Glycosyltransferase-like protein LARGE1 n=1 Tax=Macrostomum lignano TaxID=282301 RepID=A0A1I8J7M8_9PLAT